MKIKTREQKMKEYNEAYPEMIFDTEARIRDFLSHQKNPDKVLKKAQEKAAKIIDGREYESVHITLYEYPFKTDRPRTSNGHTFSPNASANRIYFHKAIHKVIDTIHLISTPAEIEIDAYLEMPKQVPPDEVVLFELKILTPEVKPDYDNIGKCYTDILTDILITDDDIFWRGQIQKFYSLLPRVEIRVRYITKHESDYIYKKLKARKTIKEGIASGQIVLKKLGED